MSPCPLWDTTEVTPDGVSGVARDRTGQVSRKSSSTLCPVYPVPSTVRGRIVKKRR